MKTFPALRLLPKERQTNFSQRRTKKDFQKFVFNYATTIMLIDLEEFAIQRKEIIPHAS